MDLHVSLKGRGDLTVRIYRQLVDAIVDGRLRRGDRLPASRELARRLSVARNTVAGAYDRLAAGGFLIGGVGDEPLVAAGPAAACATDARRQARSGRGKCG